MKIVSCYKKSASSTNVWQFGFCLYSLSVVPLHCHFLHVINGTNYFTYLLMSLSIAKLVLS